MPPSTGRTPRPTGWAHSPPPSPTTWTPPVSRPACSKPDQTRSSSARPPTTRVGHELLLDRLLQQPDRADHEMRRLRRQSTRSRSASTVPRSADRSPSTPPAGQRGPRPPWPSVATRFSIDGRNVGVPVAVNSSGHAAFATSTLRPVGTPSLRCTAGMSTSPPAPVPLSPNESGRCQSACARTGRSSRSSPFGARGPSSGGLADHSPEPAGQETVFGPDSSGLSTRTVRSRGQACLQRRPEPAAAVSLTVQKDAAKSISVTK